MEAVSFSDITADVDPAQATEFLQTWFQPDDLVSITHMRAEKSVRHNVVTQTMPVSELIEGFQVEGNLRDLVWTPGSGFEWNLYFGVCPQKRRPDSIFKRGTVNNISYTPGYWADLDVKPGSFDSQADAYDFLIKLPYIPSIVVDSGNGIHAYWCFDRETVKHDEYGPEAWWCYLQNQAGDIEIDKLADLTRVLKLPGSVAFAKEPGAPNKPVRMIYNSGIKYNERELRRYADPYYQGFLEEKKKAREREDSIFFDIENSGYMFQDDSIVSRAFKAAYLEEKVNEVYSWDWLLPQYGWTKNKELMDGSIEWTRPGETGARSAVTDFEDSNVMSLLSSNPVTDLLDLKENRIPITVFRAMLRLRFNDDVPTMMATVLKELDQMGAWA